MFGIKANGVLRISEAEELEGLDIAEHGAPAYHPESAYKGYSPIPAALERLGHQHRPAVRHPPARGRLAVLGQDVGDGPLI